MASNLFSRMSIAITNKCNQKCSWCFEGSWKDMPAQFMSLEDVERLLRWKDWNTGLNAVMWILGGEPTIHPQLLEIIDTIKAYNPRISIMLLTNLTCKQELLKELVDRKVVFFINVDQFEPDNNVHNHPRILSNLEYLNQIPNPGFRYNISATVSNPNKDFEFLYNILRSGKDKIYNLRLAPSCIGFEYNNEFQSDFSNDYYVKTLEVLTNAVKIAPNLHLSTECAINGCMISDDLFQKLKEMGYLLRYECGYPEPNADILPDLSAHWCFAFEGMAEMKINHVFDYPNYDSMLNDLHNRYNHFIKEYKSECNIDHCTHEQCKGMCGALNYYLKNNKMKLIER